MPYLAHSRNWAAKNVIGNWRFVGTYTAEKFFDDMALVTQNRADPDMVELLVTKSFDTFCWLRDKGIRFIPIYGRQAF